MTPPDVTGSKKVSNHSSSSVGSVAVLGAGAWGGTLAWLASGETGSREPRVVKLYRRKGEEFDRLVDTRELLDPLKVKLPPSCQITGDLEEAISGVDILVLACTSKNMASLASELKKILGTRVEDYPVFVSVVKGLDSKSLKTMSAVVADHIEGARVLSLSGPNLAYEIRSGQPAAAVVAHPDLELAKFVQHSLSTSRFRLYASEDLLGVELGGTLKNVIAIAAGASDGLKLGVNAKSALLTRGLAEMVRLSANLGAKPSTLFGLSGMGDLIATCEGPLSRNYRIGLYLAENLNLDEAVAKVGSVAEGVATARAVCELSKKLEIDLPIAYQVKETLDGATTPKESIMTLMGRPLATE